MVRYEYYADSHILGLRLDDSPEVFIDLAEVENIASQSEADPESSYVMLYRFADDVRNLFGNYGHLEECPLGEDEPKE